MVISSPVCGLRPLPPARVATTNTPKPVSRTSVPAFSDVRNQIEHAVDRLGRVVLGEARAFGKLLDEIVLVHGTSSFQAIRSRVAGL